MDFTLHAHKHSYPFTPHQELRSSTVKCFRRKKNVYYFVSLSFFPHRLAFFLLFNPSCFAGLRRSKLGAPVSLKINQIKSKQNEKKGTSLSSLSHQLSSCNHHPFIFFHLPYPTLYLALEQNPFPYLYLSIYLSIYLYTYRKATRKLIHIGPLLLLAPQLISP